MCESKKEQVLNMTVEELDLSVRAYNCLKRAGINTVRDLTERTYERMLMVRNLNDKNVWEVINKLASLGLTLKESPAKSSVRFRDVYHKITLVLDGGYCLKTLQMMEQQADQKMIPDGIPINSALVYGYVDKTYGFSYKVLGLAYYEDGDYTRVWPNDEIGLTVRNGCFDRFAFVLMENKALARRFAREIEIVDKGYADETDEKIRSLTYLDKFRYDDYPDDISAIFYTREGEKAKIRVRLIQYLGDQEERHYFFARLIDGAVPGFGVREGELIILVVYAENGEDIACCFKVSNG